MTPLLRVAFYHHSYKTPEEFELHSILMNKAVRAVRKHMPYAEIWHLRGNKTPKYPGADMDAVLDPMYHRPAHSAMLPSGDALFLDVDCVVQRDVYEVFKEPFDWAVCVRQQYENEPGVSLDRPAFNGGVIFSRTREFWKHFAEFIAQEDWRWNDTAIGQYVQERNRFALKVLPSSIYNYIPESPHEDLSGRAIVHYKGEKRKYWMKHLA